MKQITVILLVLLCVPMQAQKSDENLRNLQLAWQLINTFYVDTVNKQALSCEAIVSMLKMLDPHSVFIPAEDVKAANEQLNGNFEGIGVEFIILNDTLTVVNAIGGGPSEKIGIVSGDRIVAINGENMAGIGIKNSDVFKRLRGEKGTVVNLTIHRKGNSRAHEFRVTRNKIPINSIDAAYMLSDKTAYIKISRFAINTYNEFHENLEKLTGNNPQNLIIDLRGNGGGYLTAVLDIADELLDGGKLMLYTQGNASARKEFNSKRGGLWENRRLLLLIDESSASASEIVSGAIQDWDRGIVMGRRSYGKGLVQRIFKLNDESEIRLSIAKYYTPSGRCIQKPYSEGEKQYREEIANRLSHGELMNRDSIHLREDLMFKTLKHNRSVYGGGGIMPDVFVPLDTSMITPFYRELFSQGTFNLFMAHYMDENREILQTLYPDFDAYSAGFNADSEIFEALIAEARNQGINTIAELIAVSEPFIKIQIKAYIARQLWSANEYFRIVNQSTPIVVNALELVEDKERYNDVLTEER
ncbi:MAG: S41 family peptidase [Cytophagaceae bacterium]|nr:S41 family peptidase [Cytophagaceae bacterium]